MRSGLRCTPVRITPNVSELKSANILVLQSLGNCEWNFPLSSYQCVCQMPQYFFFSFLSRVSEIEEAIRKGISDADPEARAGMRRQIEKKDRLYNISGISLFRSEETVPCQGFGVQGIAKPAAHLQSFAVVLKCGLSTFLSKKSRKFY